MFLTPAHWFWMTKVSPTTRSTKALGMRLIQCPDNDGVWLVGGALNDLENNMILLKNVWLKQEKHGKHGVVLSWIQKHMEHVCTHFRDVVKEMGFAYSQPVNKRSLMKSSLLRNSCGPCWWDRREGNWGAWWLIFKTYVDGHPTLSRESFHIMSI